MDKITQRLFAGLFGTAAIIFAFAFLIHTTSPAQADNTPQTTYSTGKYMMQLSTIVDGGYNTTWYVLVWDTETGYSKIYYYTSKIPVTKATSHYQLPANPL